MASLGGKRQRRNRVLGGAAGVLVFLGASTGVFLTSDAGAGALLKILSPAGSGYDATSGDLTTSKGGAVTFTRASTWTCQDSSGAIRSLAANKPCVVDGASLRMRGAVVRLNSHPTELDNAAWTSINTPIVTADTWDFGQGTNTGEAIEDDTAAASEGRTHRYTTGTTGPYTMSVYASAGSTDTFRIVTVVNGGTGGATCTFTGLTAAAERKTCTFTAAGALTSIDVIFYIGSDATGLGSVRLGGAQLVASSQPGDLCLVGPTLQNQTCAAETATTATPAGLSRTEGSACFDVVPSWTGNNPSAAVSHFLAGNAVATVRFGYTGAGANTFQAMDGTSSPFVVADWVSGTRKRFCTRWSATQNKFRVENMTAGTASADSPFTTFPAFDANLSIGGLSGGTGQANANLNITMCKTFSGCQ